MKRLHSPLSFYFLFAISGFSGLIYESIWSHYLKLFLGHAAYAQTLVLIIFMGGMSIGAWIAGKYSLKISNLLLGYALVEGIIGICALFFHSVFAEAINFSYQTIIPALGSSVSVYVYKWTLASLLIFPQTILLGATFPLMSGGLIRSFPKNPGRALSLLYFTNSLGGAAGIIFSGFFLIPEIGLPGTVVSAGIMNLALAAMVAILSKSLIHKGLNISTRPKPQHEIKLPQRNLHFFLLIAGLTGAASFLYEIGWIRMLSLVLGSSTHAFELMLSAFILGLAVGGFLIRKKIDGITNVLYVLGIIQLAMGVLAVSTLLLYGKTFNMMSFAINALSRTDQGYILFNLFSHSLCMLIMLPATIFAGMTLPLITFHLLGLGYGEGVIGKVYAANTIGAIIGVMLGVHFIMPLLGLKHVVIIGGAIDVLLGLILLKKAAPAMNRVGWSMTTGMLVLFISFAAFKLELDPIKMASGVFRFGNILTDREVIFHKDGKTASIDVIKDTEGLTISTNGKPDANISLSELAGGDEFTMVLAAAIPLSLHKSPKNTATIGMGSGMTSHVLLADARVQQVDVIEIEPAMVEGFGATVSINNVKLMKKNFVFIFWIV